MSDRCITHRARRCGTCEADALTDHHDADCVCALCEIEAGEYVMRGAPARDLRADVETLRRDLLSEEILTVRRDEWVSIAGVVARLNATLARHPAPEPAHDCESCADCVHDGNRCCGCYDGSCCKKIATQEPGSWVHDDGSPCLIRSDSRPAAVSGERWWCLDHRQHITGVETPDDRDYEGGLNAIAADRARVRVETEKPWQDATGDLTPAGVGQSHAAELERVRAEVLKEFTRRLGPDGAHNPGAVRILRDMQEGSE